MLHELAHATEIVLTEEADILRIENAAQIDVFTREFPAVGKTSMAMNRIGFEINWPKVAKMYQGIIISPYIWARRLSQGTEWYYGWDCACGCIWDGKAIAEVIPMEKQNEHQP